jgi:hypothetical protein
MLRLRPLAVAAVVLAVATPPVATERPTGAARGKAFWAALAKDCAVPAGETAFGLVKEAVSFLGSPESEWRDDFGYSVVATCVYGKRALKPDERRALVAELSGTLRRGLGETGTDSVLLRSFSALDLSILAALEDLDPALDEAGYRQLLDTALAYLRDERDLRGFEPRVGWIHATAHTADLLKFLARDARLAKADQQGLFDAVWSKVTAEGVPVFTRAEDERLAAALSAVVRRSDFDAGILDPWLARFVAQEKQLWSQAPPRPQALDAAQNARNLLRSFFVALSLPAPAPPGTAPAAAGPIETAVREKLLATLQAIRR